MFLIKIRFVFWVSLAYFWREKGNQEIESNLTFTLDMRNYSSGVLTVNSGGFLTECGTP